MKRENNWYWVIRQGGTNKVRGYWDGNSWSLEGLPAFKELQANSIFIDTDFSYISNEPINKLP